MLTEHINKHHAECLVFFNPLGCDRVFWKNALQPDILDNYEIILIDYPGYNSDFEKLGSFQELADHIHYNLLAKITKPFHMIGYSYGGLVLQHLLNNYYDTLQSATLIACVNKLNSRDKEIVSVLKELAQKDLYLFCRILTLFSNNPEEFKTNPLIGLQKLSNIKLSLTNVNPLLQQLTHVLKYKQIDIRKQRTPIKLIFGEDDKLIDMSQIDLFAKYFDNMQVFGLEKEGHIINMNKIYNIIYPF
jgi:surfactin synthase thioesterase subunit